VAIHVRLGDILWGTHAAYRPLPMSFYRKALEVIWDREDAARNESKKTDVAGKTAAPSPGGSLVVGNVVIVTEDSSHSIVHRMAKEIHIFATAVAEKKGLSAPQRVYIQSISPSTDFCTLASARNVITAVSSFAWWASALNPGGGRGGEGEEKGGIAVLPGCAMMLPHEWKPAPRTHPHVRVRHDLTLPDLRPGTYVEGGKFGGKKGKATKNDGSLPASFEPGQCLSPAAIDAFFTSLASNLGGVSQKKAIDDLPPPLAREGSYVVPLSHLPRWAGNTAKEIETLFD
jgi:hypothetical protein